MPHYTFTSLSPDESSLFVNEAYLPEQMPESCIEPTREQKLMWEVFKQAVRGLLRAAKKETHRAKVLREETQAWIDSESMDDLYSFCSICYHMGMEPEFTRRWIKRAVKEGKVISHKKHSKVVSHA